MINQLTARPKVSILIPVFNRKEYITECIQSALDQTFEDLEVVVVDNASDDGTWETCQKFAASDERVRIYRNETNIGPVRNWMRCAEEAKGSLSKILFSDDTLEPDCLSEMVPKLDDPNIALAFCAARVGKSKDRSIIAYSHANSSRLGSKRFINLVLNGRAPVSPGAALIRTSDLLKNLHTSFPTSTPRKFENNGAGPDVMILLLTAQKYSAVANIETPLVYFRAHSGSFTNKNAYNDVAKGYHSAIALFLIKNCTRKTWLSYVSSSWLQSMRFAKNWRDPSAHLKEFEGKGNFGEVILMLVFAFVKVVKFILRR